MVSVSFGEGGIASIVLWQRGNSKKKVGKHGCLQKPKLRNVGRDRGACPVNLNVNKRTKLLDRLGERNWGPPKPF